MTKVELVTLDEVCEFILDGTHSSPKRTDSGYPVLSAQNVKDGQLNFETTRYTNNEEYENYARRLKTQRGDVLLTIVGTIGRVGLLQTDRAFVFQRSVAVLRTKPNVCDNHYLFRILDSPDVKRQLDSLTNKSSQAGIYLKKLKTVQIPLPPLAEQQRIAAILDKADSLRAKRRTALAKLDTLLQSTFLDMFGDPVTNPKNWPTKRLDEFGNITTGSTPSRKKPEYYGPFIEWIKSDNINTPFHFLTPAQEFLSELGARAGRTVPAQSILVTCIAGSPDCIGNAAITDREVSFNQQINALTPINEGTTFFLYVHLLVGKKLVQNASTNSMKGMVSKSSFSAVKFICPPLELQRQFSRIAQRIQQTAEKYSCSINQLDSLFNSLQQRAFKGEL